MIDKEALIEFLDKIIEDNRRRRESEEDQRQRAYYEGKIDAFERVKDYLEGL